MKTIEDESEIINDIEDELITHLWIGNGVIPRLEVIAPKLTHLGIMRITESSQLDRYVATLEVSRVGRLGEGGGCRVANFQTFV